MVLSGQKSGARNSCTRGLRQLQLAKRPTHRVLFTAADLPVEVEEPILTVDEPEVAQLKQAPVMAVKPTGEEVELAQVVTPPPAPEPIVAQAEPEQPAATLPATASSLPLIALFGFLALGLAWTLRLVQKRVL